MPMMHALFFCQRARFLACVLVFRRSERVLVRCRSERVLWPLCAHHQRVLRRIAPLPLSPLQGKAKPNYFACVKIVTAAALTEMRLPGMLAAGLPVVVGLTFRIWGEMTGRPLLGAEVLCSFLMFATLTGLVQAMYLDNVGGSWDNAKKYIEMGNFGGKGSEAHKAAITGDTVGDPFKDTAGPALHVVIKLLSTTVLVLGPLFVGRQSAGPELPVE